MTGVVRVSLFGVRHRRVGRIVRVAALGQDPAEMPVLHNLLGADGRVARATAGVNKPASGLRSVASAMTSAASPWCTLLSIGAALTAEARCLFEEPVLTLAL